MARKKYTIEDMQKLAEERGGKCLSEEYVNSHTKLKWQCSEGHQWQALPINIVHKDSWCPTCAGNVKFTIEYMRKIANDRGGECLSKEYINNRTKLKWRCSEGHEWEADAGHIVGRGSWCRTCKGLNKSNIEEMQSLAEKRGGKCLSKIYVNTDTNLNWRCSEGHTWSAKPAHIKRNSWCPYCAGRITDDINSMRELAKQKGGKCLSEKYVNAHTKLKWQCHNSHIWDTAPVRIKSGNWCPTCSTGIRERICKSIMEDILEVKLEKILHDWLINPHTGYPMELDGHSSKRKIAFEYHGEQHYRKIKHWHIVPGQYEEQIYRDKTKRELCANNSVILITIPFHIHNNELPHFIYIQLEKRDVINLKKPKAYKHYETLVYREDPFRDRLTAIKILANEKGGECLSDKYINSKTKLKFRCSEGHEWEADATHINQGRWCPHCAGNVRNKIETYKEIALKRGGKCISNTYINAHTKIWFRCSEGHEWSAVPNSIQQGIWCPTCAGRHKTIEDMKSVAINRGGDCLSSKYLGSHTKLQWKCKEGHIWWAIPTNILKNSWCPECAREKRRKSKS